MDTHFAHSQSTGLVYIIIGLLQWLFTSGNVKPLMVKFASVCVITSTNKSLSRKEIALIGLHESIVHLSYFLMSKCWHMDSNERPTFSELVTSMSQLLASLADYMDVFTFGEREAQSKDLAGDTDDKLKVKKKCFLGSYSAILQFVHVVL